MNRGALVILPIGVMAGVFVAYQADQDRRERQAFEDAMFAQLVEERERERERKEHMREQEAAQRKRRGFWG
jgi:hypothetical protein